MLPDSPLDGQLAAWARQSVLALSKCLPVLRWTEPERDPVGFFLGVRMLRTRFLAVVLCLLGGFASAQSVRAQVQAAVPAQGPVAPVTDITKISDEALVWLQDLIRINTSNPPGNELLAAKYVGSVLQKEGIPFEIFESAPGRGIIVARLSAGPFPDPSHALLLMAHLDVVGVDKTKWTVDPFGGVIKDGYLYGRGAIDDKGMLAANLATFIALKRTNAHLNRDVIFFSEGDEEAGGETGIKFAVEKHWDKIACGFALNEGGNVFMKDGKVQYVGIQATEKVPVNVDVTATGTSGHASIPLSDNPVVHLAAAIEKIGAYQAPVQFNTVTRSYFEQLSKLQDEETAKWMRALQSSDRQEHAARIISQNPFWNAMLRDTVSPTMLQAGIRVNVIPPVARGALNIRLMPGNLADSLIAKLTEIVNDPHVKLEVRPDGSEAAPGSALDSELYKTILKVAATDFQGAPSIPMMSTWFTDSTPLRLRSVQAYGLVPFPLTDADLGKMHADDERVPVESFRKGVVFLYHVVTGFAVEQ
jgi:acetylornithine deacetylase/succinyl-diaminopimelate desuccinylase-like protein